MANGGTSNGSRKMTDDYPLNLADETGGIILLLHPGKIDRVRKTRKPMCHVVAGSDSSPIIDSLQDLYRLGDIGWVEFPCFGGCGGGGGGCGGGRCEGLFANFRSRLEGGGGGGCKGLFANFRSRPPLPENPFGNSAILRG